MMILKNFIFYFYGMASDTFYLDFDATNYAVIRQQHSDLAITIFNLATDGFENRTDKLQLFAELHGVTVAFQCDPVDHHFETDVITAALQWYAGYVNYPQMSVGVIDPRPAIN